MCLVAGKRTSLVDYRLPVSAGKGGKGAYWIFGAADASLIPMSASSTMAGTYSYATWG